VKQHHFWGIGELQVENTNLDGVEKLVRKPETSTCFRTRPNLPNDPETKRINNNFVNKEVSNQLRCYFGNYVSFEHI
jgi:hypothetical protein